MKFRNSVAKLKFQFVFIKPDTTIANAIAYFVPI